jgi:hypothetical protein
MIKLQLPLKNISVTQPFGVNFVTFYSQLGLKGHNGVDFSSKNGCKCYAAHGGEIIFAGKGGDGGIGVEIWDKVQMIKTIYYHFKEALVKVGDKVVEGQLIGLCDNTGIYTTGDHLHFGLKNVDENGNTLDYENGYKGAIDPTPYFVGNYQGWPIKNKDCYKSNAYHRYFRTDRNIKLEIKYWALLPRMLKRVPTQEIVNAVVYGAWDRDIVANDAMFQLYGFITKAEYLNKIVSFS